MFIQSLFALNILIHIVAGAYILKVLLKGFHIKTTWQQAGLITLAIIVGMQLLTRASLIFNVPNRIILVVVAAWTFVGAGGFLSYIYELQNKKLYLTAGMWGLALLVISFLISVLDRILISSL